MLLKVALAVLAFYLLVRLSARWVRETRTVLAGRRQQAMMQHLDWTRETPTRRRLSRTTATQPTPWIRRG